MAICYVTLNRKRLPASGWGTTFSPGRLSTLTSGRHEKAPPQQDRTVEHWQRLRKSHDVWKLLAKCGPAQRKAILKVADDSLVRTICACFLNVLKETVPVDKPTRRKLLAYEKSLIALAEKSTPINKKKQILVQHGGKILSVLLPPLYRVLSSTLA